MVKKVLLWFGIVMVILMLPTFSTAEIPEDFWNNKTIISEETSSIQWEYLDAQPIWEHVKGCELNNFDISDNGEVIVSFQGKHMDFLDFSGKRKVESYVSVFDLNGNFKYGFKHLSFYSADEAVWVNGRPAIVQGYDTVIVYDENYNVDEMFSFEDHNHQVYNYLNQKERRYHGMTVKKKGFHLISIDNSGKETIICSTNSAGGITFSIRNILNGIFVLLIISINIAYIVRTKRKGVKRQG